MIKPTYPRGRLDALNDGVFAVAMTLLVLDVRLPEEFHPQDTPELLRGLIGLLPKFLPYVLSFLVLGHIWLANLHARSRSEFFGREYVLWWLIYLLLITCVPFSTIVIGRFVHLAPAVWLYALNMILIAAVGLRLLALTEVESSEHRSDRKLSLAILIASSALAIAWSFIDPGKAMWAFVLNLGSPMLVRLRQKR